MKVYWQETQNLKADEDTQSQLVAATPTVQYVFTDSVINYANGFTNTCIRYCVDV